MSFTNYYNFYFSFVKATLLYSNLGTAEYYFNIITFVKLNIVNFSRKLILYSRKRKLKGG